MQSFQHVKNAYKFFSNLRVATAARLGSQRDELRRSIDTLVELRVQLPSTLNVRESVWRALEAGESCHKSTSYHDTDSDYGLLRNFVGVDCCLGPVLGLVRGLLFLLFEVCLPLCGMLLLVHNVAPSVSQTFYPSTWDTKYLEALTSFLAYCVPTPVTQAWDAWWADDSPLLFVLTFVGNVLFSLLLIAASWWFPQTVRVLLVRQLKNATADVDTAYQQVSAVVTVSAVDQLKKQAQTSKTDVLAAPTIISPSMPAFQHTRHVERHDGTGQSLVELMRSTLVGSGAVAGTGLAKATVAGLGGVGKTTLARHYVFKYNDQYPYAIWWVSAEKRGGVDTSFARLAERMHDDRNFCKGRNTGEIMASVSDTLSRPENRGWLIVFDNADYTSIKEYCEAVSGVDGGHVIITSRRRDTDSECDDATVITVGVYTPEEAMRFMCPEENQVAECRRVCEALGWHALALLQAKAMVLKRKSVCGKKWSYGDFLHKFQKQPMNEAFGFTGHCDLTIQTLWAMQLVSLSSGAVSMLQTSSLLAPDSIPGSLMRSCCDADDDEFVDSRSELEEASLLTVRNEEDGGGFCDMHRLLQQVVREAMSQTDLHAKIMVTLNALHAEASKMDDDPKTWNPCSQLDAHVSVWSSWARQQEKTSHQSPGKAASLVAPAALALPDCIDDKDDGGGPFTWLWNACSGSDSGGEEGFEAASKTPASCFKLCEANLTGLLEAERKTPNPNPINFSISGVSYTALVRARVQVNNKTGYQRALLRVPQSALNHFDRDDDNAFLPLRRDRDRYDVVSEGAEMDLALFLKALKDTHQKETERGKLLLKAEAMHMKSAKTLSLVGDAYRRQGRYDAAHRLMSTALEWGVKHPGHLNTLTGIAIVKQSQGDYEGAMVLYKECLVGRAEVLGVKHPDYLNTLNNMANVKSSQGDYEGAMFLFEQCKAGRAEVLGVKHPQYLRTLHNIANAQESQGNYEGAMVLYKECQVGRAEVLGVKHPDYLNTLTAIAIVKQNQGDYKGAMVLYEECKAGLAAALGNKHPLYWWPIGGMAVVKLKQGDYESAMVLFEQCKAGRAEVLGIKHPDYLWTLKHMSAAETFINN